MYVPRSWVKYWTVSLVRYEFQIETHHISHGYFWESFNGSREEPRKDTARNPLAVGVDIGTAGVSNYAYSHVRQRTPTLRCPVE